MDNNLSEGQYRFWDANGVPWIWDSNTHTVYVEGTLEEDETSGYYACTLTDALRLLEEYGFMWVEKDK